MPIAFGNELNSSIDHDDFLDPRRRADRAMVPRGQAPRCTRKKIECGGKVARHSSRPRKHGVEDRCNQDRGDDKRGEGHHSSSPSASNLSVLTCFNAAMNALCIAVGWRGGAGPEDLAILVTVGSMRSAHEPGGAP